MSRSTGNILDLSAKQRELLDLLLQEQGLAASEREEIPRRAIGAAAPLSFAQQRLWYLDQLEPNSLYNVCRAFRLRGALDVEALSKALNIIVSRHEVLRTTFSAENGLPLQHIRQNRQADLRLVDLSHVPVEVQDQELDRLIIEENGRAFDLSNDLMMRATLFKLAAEQHVLVLVIHHIASDAWSMRVLLRELGALYEAFLLGTLPSLPELPVQYADFAAWQRQRLQGEVLEGHLAYWREQLKDAPPLLELPTDWPRPEILSYRGGRQRLLLSEALTEALKTLSRRDGVTLFMVFLAAFKILLHRWSGQQDIVVGTPVTGRGRVELEGLIGLFINALVLRTKIAGEPTFREWLGQVRESCVGAYSHQDLPFERLVEELQPARDSSRAPLFQVLFDMLNLPVARTELHGLKIENMPRPREMAKYDLILFVIERDPQTQLEFAFSAELFRQERVAEMLEQYKVLLEQVAENPDRKITDYALVTPWAKKRLPDPTAPLSESWQGAVHELFAAEAERYPDKLAVQDPREAWTYKELNEQSNRLAHYLLAQEIGREDIVAIYGHRCAALVWALLGVLKAGAAFCIMDPSHPAARVNEYLSATNPKALIVIGGTGKPGQEIAQVLSHFPVGCKITLPGAAISDATPLLAQYSQDGPAVEIGPDHLAYVIFTSGSTGKPKGVMGRHGPLTHFLPWVKETFRLSQNDRFSFLSGLATNKLQREVFTALCLGATLCIPDPEDIGALGKLDAWLRKEAVSVVHLTPAMAQLLEETATLPLPAVRRVFFGGDLLRLRDVDRARRLMPNAEIANFYNSSETQRGGSYFVFSRQALNEVKETPPLGRGVKDVQLLVLNGAGQLAGVSELGEIYVRSPHMARGYLGDDKLTKERFITNPFTGLDGDRLYRTGEFGRFLPDGSVEFASRQGDQVSIRGFRIDLGEIESVLGQHPAVREAIIAARDDDSNESRLVAYVVSKHKPAPTPGELRRYLRQRLPDYMVPVALVYLEAIPLTPTGKADRRALPAPEQAPSALHGTFLPPRTPLEAHIAEVWKEVLGVDRVGVYDNFFDLGGHSLLSVQAVALLEKKTGVKIHPKSFVTQTLAQIASAYEKRMQLRGEAGPASLTRKLWNSLKNALFQKRNDAP